MFQEYVYNNPMARGNMNHGTMSNQMVNFNGHNMAGVLAIVFGIFLIIGLISLAITVITIVSQWFVFKKAKKEGWEAIVPIYNLIVLYQIAGVSPWLLLIYLVGWVPIIGWLAVIGLSIYHSIMLAKSFGKTPGFGIGVWLLPYVFYPIIAFSKNINYVEPAGEQTKAKVGEVVKSAKPVAKPKPEKETVVEATIVDESTSVKKAIPIEEETTVKENTEENGEENK
ncbi:MAG: DUF5684 domain-containing protein [Oscillospiraceae bacterium]|nr:DUF5684 domain-containing protein [Oscillospiraceae bacterium]